MTADGIVGTQTWRRMQGQTDPQRTTSASCAAGTAPPPGSSFCTFGSHLNPVVTGGSYPGRIVRFTSYQVSGTNYAWPAVNFGLNGSYCRVQSSLTAC